MYVTGCLVCGKPYDQIKEGTFADYLVQSTETHETIRERLVKRQDFLECIQCGSFTFVALGVSQAATSDEQTYGITYGNICSGLNGELMPLF